MKKEIDKFLDGVSNGLFPQYKDGGRNFSLLALAMVDFSVSLIKTLGYQEIVKLPTLTILRPIVFSLWMKESPLKTR